MNTLKYLSTFLIAVFVFSLTAVAQSDVKAGTGQSYDITLHLLAGSKDPSGPAVLPKELSAVAGKLRDQFGTVRINLTDTYFGRVAAGGTFDHKSVSNIRAEGVSSSAPTFLDFRLGIVNQATTSDGKPIFTARTFRFGSRVPVPVFQPSSESRQAISAFNYESIGVSVDQLSVPENSPTLIGTLNLPNSDAIFLVLTVKRSGI